MSKYSLSFLSALSLHAVLMGSFLLDFSEEHEAVKVTVDNPPEIIHAAVIADEWVTAKALELQVAQQQRDTDKQQKTHALTQQIQQQEQRLEQIKAEQLAVVEQQEKQRLDNIKQEQVAVEQRKQAVAEQARVKKAQKIAAEKVKQQQIATQKKAVEQERKRVAEVARQKAVAVEKQRVAAVAQQKSLKIAAEKKENLRLAAVKQQKIAVAKQQRQQVLQAQRNAQLAAEKAARIEQGVASASSLIKRKVNQNWNPPIAVNKGLVCTIRVDLIPSGDVMSVQVIKSSGNQLFDDSAERAVYKASPLPVPQAADVFKKFRRFSFIFSPES